MENLKKRAQYFLERNNVLSGDGDEISKVVNPVPPNEADDENTNTVDACHNFTMYTPESFEAIVEKGRKKLKPRTGIAKLLLGQRPQSDENANPNFIIDVYVLHDEAKDGVYDRHKISEDQVRSGVRSLHDFYRNTGHHEYAENTDTGINIGMGNIHYINGHEVWGEDWDSGIAYNSTDNGVRSATVIKHCKQVGGSTGDGSRYAIILYPKLTGSTAYGYAWVGSAGSSYIAGQFTRTLRFGDKRYQTSEEEYYGGWYENKTCIHEFGHSIGLYHTFQGCESCGEIHTPLQGDKVGDTIPHPKGYSCGIPNDQNPHNNIMSYSYHTRRKVITPGQKERGLAVVANQYPLMYQNPVYNWDEVIISGCTNPAANNYNPLATVDDGSCDLRIKGCMNPDFVEYNPDAELWDFTACKTPHVDGCTDPKANNYNPNATRDDGSCEYVSTEPEYKEDRVGYIGAKHHFGFGQILDFVGELFAVKNTQGKVIPIVIDECGDSNLNCVYQRMVSGENYTLTSITDQITGYKHPQNSLPLIIKDGNIAIDFTSQNDGLVLKGIDWDDYMISMLQYQELEQSGIMCHAVKRKGWPDSAFILVTQESKGKQLSWDNTQGNRQFNGGLIPNGEFHSITASRNNGTYVDSVKVLDSGSPKNGINYQDLVIGSDPLNPNRMSGARLYELTICTESKTEQEIFNFEFSRKTDYLV